VLVTTKVRLAVEIVRLMRDCVNLRLGRSPKILDTSFGGFFLELLTAAAGKGVSLVAVNTRHIASLQKY